MLMGCAAFEARAAMWGPAVRGVIESMNGARFVHDRLEEDGWEGADRRRRPGSRGWRPLACKTDEIDASVLATLAVRDLVPEIWLPDPSVRRERELARFKRIVTGAAWRAGETRRPGGVAFLARVRCHVGRLRAGGVEVERSGPRPQPGPPGRVPAVR
jgi:hypothetical protein